ncbi:uncharacterized protein EV422DRAFT_526846 [Fimicolochytrium jonesii]|uniref:uncharacterized protein n=1 Tax=Fimicolochytrium jonesii TaxID=1396493 RepID=UPI0022FEC005|nr:uncharacterized protein EV422DRAFT_526846 [Fimicolochytrium jonesii]KAI8821761.1 hypothetical protein EV422DRAFT_526846 [Fimicolochytrium jonesii]
MGKGIATHFKHLFGGVSVLKAQNRNVGHVAILTPLTAPRVEPHPAVYLITKQRYYGKPTLATLRASLVDLRRVCEEMGISELAMPRIGCGLDALRWDAVVSMLKEVFQGTEMRVHVFHI